MVQHDFNCEEAGLGGGQVIFLTAGLCFGFLEREDDTVMTVEALLGGERETERKGDGA